MRASDGAPTGQARADGICLATGASRGVGRAGAIRYAQESADLTLAPVRRPAP